jgi:translation initiation factor IF-2
MKLKEIVENLGLEVKSAQGQLDNEVTGGYASDLLSDVMAHSEVGNIWITLQTHQNIVAVATLKELSGIIITNNRQPEEDTQRKAEEEMVPIMTTSLSSFETVGRLYQAGITGT